MEIKIDHLRVGNLVEVELLGKVTIESIFLTGQVEVSAFKLISGEITKVFYTFNISELKPIPITEEILLKYGFEKIENNWKVLDFIFFKISWERLAGLTLTFENESIYLPHIKYLHQLQNIYFSLTVKELIYEK